MCSCVYIRVSVRPCTFTLDCTAWYGCLCVPAGVHLKKRASAGPEGAEESAPLSAYVTERDGGSSRGRGLGSGPRRQSLAQNSLILWLRD